MKTRVTLAAVAAVTLLLGVSGPATAAEVDFPRNASPSWFTDDFRERVDAAGSGGVPVDGPAVSDVCPGVAVQENGIGPGTCLVYPFGCTANFVYYNGSGSRAGTVARNGNYYLGTAGHCVEKNGEAVYAAVSTPGVGPSIKRIGTVSKHVDDYPESGNVHDFASIRIADGVRVYPQSPVGGPMGIYDGCQAGQPVKYYGHGYEVAVAQGKPGGGASTHWYTDGFGWAGPIFGGDSGSGVLHADGRAVGDLTAMAIVYPPAFAPGESIGSRITWILRYLGSSYKLVNQDYTLSRDTTSPCGSASWAPLAGDPTKQLLGPGRGGGKPPKP